MSKASVEGSHYDRKRHGSGRDGKKEKKRTWNSKRKMKKKERKLLNKEMGDKGEIFYLPLKAFVIFF